MKKEPIKRPKCAVIFQHEFEQDWPPSLTVEGEAFTIRELMQKYNVDMDQNDTPYYDVENLDDLVNLNQLDLVDIDRLKTRLAYMEKSIEQQLQKQMAEQPAEPAEPTPPTP